MDIKNRKQERLKKKWIKELQIKEFSPIHKVKMEKIRWCYDQKCWEILLNKNSKEMVIAHELGHLYFPKRVNDLRLHPKLAKPEKRGELNRGIHNLLNSLIDNFVDWHLLDIDNYYNIWLEEKRKNLENGIYLGEFRGVSNLIADYMCEYLNWNYILKEKDRDSLQ